MKEDKKTIFKVGINDADYKVKTNGVTCPYYKTWHRMMRRGYDNSFKTKNPAYKNTTVTKSWHKFSVFKLWMEKQDWKNKDLDKDLINPGNTVYSERDCAFVSKALNRLFSHHSQSELPTGITFRRNRYEARVTDNNKTINIGTFTSMEEARLAYLKKKIEIVQNIIDQERNIHIQDGLHRKIAIMYKDIIILECQIGIQHYCCFDCGEKYIGEGRKAYDGSITVHNGMCDICKRPETVGPSRKIFGFHRMI